MFIKPCMPTISRTVPIGPGWAYEIKHDGFRFLAVRQGKRVRVFSRGGHDWAKQLPTIVEAMQAVSVRSVARCVLLTAAWNRSLAREVLDLRPEVIVATATPAVVSLTAVTKTVPIVCP